MLEAQLKFKSIYSSILIVAIAVLINIVSNIYFSKTLSSQNDLSTEINNIQQQQEIIKELYEEIGYGGFIHNFKNFLIRADFDKYTPRIEKNIVKIRRLISILESKPLNSISHENFRVISSTFENYFSKYAYLKKKVRTRNDINALDNVIKIDDEPALKAFAIINRQLSQKDILLRTQLSLTESNARLMSTISNILLLTCIMLAAYIIFKYQKKLNRKYQEAERAKEIIDASDIGVWEIDLRNMESTWSDVTANIHEVDKDYQINPEKGIEFFKEGESRDLIKRSFSEAVRRGEKYDIELPFITAKRNEKWVRSIGIPVLQDGKVVKVYGTFQDITARKEAELLLIDKQNKLDKANKKLIKLSYQDALTKIPNRRAYENKLISEINIATRAKHYLSLMIIDIDDFKKYNDTYGHENGDVALFTVAKKLKDSLPRATDFLARYGGEEFVVLLPDTPLEAATEVATRIINNVTSSGIEHTKSPFKKLTVSIGIFSTDKLFNNLLFYADKALYKAKSNGRNRYEVFHEHASK